MKISIGADCENIHRFEAILKDKKLLNKLFTEKEIKYCLKKADPKRHFAVRFAGKEAIIKALNSSDKKISINKIEILNNKNGVPIVNINGDNPDFFDIKLSLSHSKDTAIAFALLIQRKSND